MKKWLSTFWWARGVLSAISIAAFLPKIVDLSRIEILRAFHSVLWAWNDLMAALGEYLGAILSIPAVPPFWINFLVYLSSLAVPMSYGAAQSKVLFGETGSQKKIKNFFLSIVLFCLPVLPIFFNNHQFESYFLMAVFCFILGFMLTTSLNHLPGYGRGLVTFVSFVLCLEVLYWLQTPIVTEAINSFSCSHMDTPSPGCPDDTSK